MALTQLPVIEIGATTYRARCSYCGVSTLVRKVRLETGGHGYRCSVCNWLNLPNPCLACGAPAPEGQAYCGTFSHCKRANCDCCGKPTKYQANVGPCDTLVPTCLDCLVDCARNLEEYQANSDPSCPPASITVSLLVVR